MNSLSDILSNGYKHLDMIIYVLICKNNKFYVGQTNNIEARLKAHFIYKQKVQFLRFNEPIDLLFFIRTGVRFKMINDLEDYVTVLVSKKYGAENVFGGFRHLKKPDQRIKFVEEYDLSANKSAANIIAPLIDFELPEVFEINKIIKD